MTSQRVLCGPLMARIRECWVLKENLRVSYPSPPVEPSIHTIVIESVDVEPAQRRQGHFKRFLQMLVDDPRFEMVIVEGVGNAHLADALLRWGWDWDPQVKDFYWVQGTVLAMELQNLKQQRNATQAEVTSDGHVVWVNSSDGCLARFAKNGIDIHKDVAGQVRDGDPCLDCTSGPTTLADWQRFVAGVKQHHGVDVSPEHMPIFLRTVDMENLERLNAEMLADYQKHGPWPVYTGDGE